MNNGVHVELELASTQRHIYANGDLPEWIKTFALLFAQGLSYESCAQRLNKSPATLKGLMLLPAVDALVRSYLAESNIDFSTKMIKGSRVDCVLTLIKLRDDSTVNAAIRAKICFFLLGMNYGTSTTKAGLGTADDDDSLDTMVRRHGAQSLNDALEKELARLMADCPAAQRLVKASN